MIEIGDEGLRIRTQTMEVTVEGVTIRDMVNRMTGERVLGSPGEGADPLVLVYRGGEEVPVPANGVRYIRIHDDRVDAVCGGWRGDGIVRFAVDRENGDLLVTTSAFAARGGVRAVRYKLGPVEEGAHLVAPLFQGVDLPVDDPLLVGTHWEWPMRWEAALAIVTSGRGGFYAWARDTRYRYKALAIAEGGDPFAFGLDTQSYGPLGENLSAGGLTWRLNAFEGSWREAAGAYRDWLWEAYGLEEDLARRPDWHGKVRFAVSWCPTDRDLLEALRERVDPDQILLHVPGWRTDGYDENYPRYEASREGARFIRRAQRLGFHVMPHFNAVDMDPQHPVFHTVRDFVYRDLETGARHGWSWDEGRMLGVPDSNRELVENRDKKVMVKIHPGLSMWRTLLVENVAGAVRELGLEHAFIDVTLCSGNLKNCLVENTTSTEGMRLLADELGRLDGGLAVSGEGRNEITAQKLAFAQSHLFQSFHSTVEGLGRVHCDLGDLLYGDLCRLIGYSGLAGGTEESRVRIGAHAAQGAIPTITIGGAGEIRDPNPAVRALLEGVE